jgi:hypothetical protein
MQRNLSAPRVSQQLQTHLESERDRLAFAAASGGRFSADATPVLLKHEDEYKAVFGVIRTPEVRVALLLLLLGLATYCC